MSCHGPVDISFVAPNSCGVISDSQYLVKWKHLKGIFAIRNQSSKDTYVFLMRNTRKPW